VAGWQELGQGGKVVGKSPPTEVAFSDQELVDPHELVEWKRKRHAETQLTPWQKTEKSLGKGTPRAR